MKSTINIGAGTRIYKHYPDKDYDCLNIDCRPLPNLNFIADVKRLSMFESNYFDYILASDVIGHFPAAETEQILLEWFRVLKQGGTAELKFPDQSSGEFYEI